MALLPRATFSSLGKRVISRIGYRVMWSLSVRSLRNCILISSNRSRDFIHISFDFVHFGMKVFY